MTWGEESEGRSEDFEARALDPARYLDPETSAQLGVSSTAPEVDAQDESGGLVDVKASGGRSAWRRRLAPRHRNAVKAFFGATQPNLGEDER